MRAYCTDTGNVKRVNQDACMIMEAKIGKENLVFAAVCDGMGGLKDGEVASARMIEALRKWFRDRMPVYAKKGAARETVTDDLNKVILSVDKQLHRYSEAKGDCGTTLAGIVLYGGRYLCVNVGDSRAYRITKSEIFQLTHDQTVAQQMADDGDLSAKEAETHPGQSILLQCIGAGGEVVPDYTWGLCEKEDLFLLCSDGFRHVLTKKEIHSMFLPEKFISDRELEKGLQDAVKKVKSRGERDNITAAAVTTGDN